MFLPFVLAEVNGIHHRVHSDDSDAIILPNIPTVCLTDEDGHVNGCCCRYKESFTFNN